MVFLYILLFLLALFLILLFVPVCYRVGAAFGTATDTRVEVFWLFKLIHIHYVYQEGKTDFTARIVWLRFPRQTKKSVVKPKKAENHVAAKEKKVKPKKVKKQAEPTPSTQKEQTPKTETVADKWKLVKAVLTYPERKTIMNITLRFIKKVFRACKPDLLDVEGVVGLGDPYTTGLLLGAYEAAAGMMRLRRSIRISGDFNETVLKLKLNIAGKIRFGTVIWPFIWLCTRRPVFSILLDYIRKDRDESDGKRKR